MNNNICKDIIPEQNSPCRHYIKPGLCAKNDMFRCVEFIARFEPRLSYSGVNNFMKCPRQYYLSNIKGIQMKEENQIDALKIGKFVDQEITGGRTDG